MLESSSGTPSQSCVLYCTVGFIYVIVLLLIYFRQGRELAFLQSPFYSVYLSNKTTYHFQSVPSSTSKPLSLLVLVLVIARAVS